MGAAAALDAARRLSTPKTTRRAVIVALLALPERLLTPALAYAFLSWGRTQALVIALGLSTLLTVRGIAQRSFSARNEAELYIRVVDSVLGRDVLQANVLPDEEARASLFEGIYRVAGFLADGLPNLAANAIAALVLGIVVAVSQPVRLTLVAFGSLALGGVVLITLRGWVARAQRDVWVAWGSVADSVTDAWDGRLELVAAGRDGDYRGRFERAASAWGVRARRAARVAGVSGRGPLLLLAAAVGAVVAGDAWMHGVPWTTAVERAVLLASNAPAFVGLGHGLQELLTHENRLRLVKRVVGAPLPTRAGSVAPPRSPRQVECKEVSFAYAAGAGEALRGVSLTWRTGELLALSGPNGSGKSTCLRALLALAEPSHGEVLVDGVPMAELDPVPWRRSIGFLPQRSYLPPRATVRECLRFVEGDTADDTMRDALEQVGLLPKLHQQTSGDPLALRVGSLSVGERQRVALARVLCRKVPMLLLDEPDANLDRDGIQLVAELVARLARDRMVLVVAHAPEILERADRVVHLQAGSVRAAPA